MSTVVTTPGGSTLVVSGGTLYFDGNTKPTHNPIGAYPRTVDALVGINGINVWGDIKGYNTSLEYTDVASGSTDSFDISMFDIDKHFYDDWLIDSGTSLNAKIKFNNWDAQGDVKWIDCGEFLVDAVAISGFPIEVDVKSVAIPVNGTKNTRKWENIAISAIANDICSQLGVGLEYYAADITLKSRQQSQQTDINFLFSLCNEYGFGMKVYKNKIIIFDRAARDAETPVNLGDPYYIERIAEDFDIQDNTEGVYTGVRAIYKPEESDTESEYILGTTEKMLVVENAGSTQAEAQIKAAAALYNANIERVKLKFTMRSYYPIYAGSNYYIYGLGKYSGAYGIEKVTHTVSTSAAYTAKVEAHAIALEKERADNGATTQQSAPGAETGGGNIAAGVTVELESVPLYISSTATSPVGYRTGTYYLYDGVDFNGRYRICDAADVGQTPVGEHVTGYIDAQYI